MNQGRGNVQLDKLIIRDATEDELGQLEEMTKAMLYESPGPGNEEVYGRCSLIQMTPRDSSDSINTDRDGQDSARGHT